VKNGWENTGGGGGPNQCTNALDEDNDYVNDGCGAVGAAETGAQCNNRFDDDQDGAVNDGCPQVGAVSEATIGACGNNTSDDNDGVNDGCPIVGLVAETGAQCDNALDDDTGGADGTVNDGCPGVMAQIDQDIPRGSAAADSGPLNDGIGDACEPDWNGDGIVGAMVGGGSECISGAADCTANPADWKLMADRPDGHYHKDFARDAAKGQAACVGAVDTDGDGWCDATETALGSCAADPCPDPPYTGSPAANTSTPENRLLEYNVDPAPQGCTDFAVYGHPDTGPVDNDADTLANAADPGCAALGAGDADGDIVAATGTDADEHYLGTDPLDNCPDNTYDPAWPLDQNNDGTILVVGDVTKYTGKTFKAVTCPGADLDCRLDLNKDGTILVVGDVTKYTGQTFKACTP